MNRDQLLEALENDGVAFFQQDFPGGGTLVATRRGARVLGLFPSGKGASSSALWINPRIEAVLSGNSPDWAGEAEAGMGGDRLWVAPEQRYYYRAPGAFGDWFTPPEMDPGRYEASETGPLSIRYSNRFDLVDQIRGTVLKDLLLQRSIRLLDNPLAATADSPGASGALGYAGVETTEEIELPAVPGAPAPVLCPWGLVQVPVAPEGAFGSVVIPTARPATPVHYFGPIPEDRLMTAADHVTFKIDSLRIAKLGIPAEDLPAAGPVRIAYLRPVQMDEADFGAPDMRGRSGDAALPWMLVVRESEAVARSSAEALDPAKAAPDGPRGVIQSYNNGSPNHAQFGEIEMQYLPVRLEGGVWRSTAVTRLLAYHGRRTDILAAAGQLLGLPAIRIFE